MRVKLGIIAPFVIQIGITFLYSTITYERLENSLVATLGMYIFPILLVYLLAPQFISRIIFLKSRISKQIRQELDELVMYDRYGQEEGRTQLIENRFPSVGENIQTISSSIKSHLTPLITNRAYNYYKDSFYSRDEKIRQVRSLNYYEAMVLFSSISLIFFVADFIIVQIMSFRSIDFYFIELDIIENSDISRNVTLVMFAGILMSALILRYAANKMMYYLPYAIPVLFNEPAEEQYLRRETIRSIVNYNFDNLIDRSDQRRIQDQIKEIFSNQLDPLLTEEVMITARTEFAHKLAWREYSKLIEADLLNRDGNVENKLESLSKGKQVGPVQLDEKDLLGLHSDVQYINHTRKHWEEVTEEMKAFVYFQLYRVVEFVMRETSKAMGLHEGEQEFSLYSSINTFYDQGLIDKVSKDELHNLRYRRNKLMHEVGASLDVSLDSMEYVMDALEMLLVNLDKNYSSDDQN